MFAYVRFGHSKGISTPGGLVGEPDVCRRDNVARGAASKITAAEGCDLPVKERCLGPVKLWLTKSSEHQVIATEPEQAGSRQSHERPSGVMPGRPLPFSRATLTHLANRLAPESRDGTDAMPRNRYTDKPPDPVKEIP